MDDQPLEEAPPTVVLDAPAVVADELALRQAVPIEDLGLAPPPPETLGDPSAEPIAEAAAEPTGAAARPMPFERVRRVPGWLAAFAVVAATAAIRYPRYVTRPCTILPSAHVEVRAEEAGIIERILADEGQHVRAGDVVVELDPRDVVSEIQMANAELARLTAALQLMLRGARNEEVASAEAALAAQKQAAAFARVNAQRAAKMYREGVASAERRDRAQRDYDVARATVQQLEAQLRLVRAGARSQEIEMAKADVESAEARLKYLAGKRQRLDVRSPIEGEIVTRRLIDRQGAHVERGELVFEASDTRTVEAEIYVPEHELDLLAIGQPVAVKARGVPRDEFRGTLMFIAPTAEEIGPTRVVRALTALENKDGLLRGSMTGYAEVDTGRVSLLELGLRRAVRWCRVRFLF